MNDGNKSPPTYPERDMILHFFFYDVSLNYLE